jgi:hypothetical protein
MVASASLPRYGLTRGQSRTRRPGGGIRRVAVSANVEVIPYHHEGTKDTKSTKKEQQQDRKTW